MPLPTRPPYTAFIGNLAFDLTEGELGSFFSPHEVRMSSQDVRDGSLTLNSFLVDEECQNHPRPRGQTEGFWIRRIL